MKLTVAIITDGREKNLEMLKDSLQTNSCRPEDLELYLLDNKNNAGLDLTKFWDGCLAEHTQVTTNTHRFGLATCWNQCVDEAHNNMVLICNDDIVFSPKWDTRLQNYTESHPREMYMVCHPNSWSAFTINKRFHDEIGRFRDEFPLGGCEDDDFYLRIADKFNIRTRDQMYQEKLLSLTHQFNTGLCSHVPIVDTGRREWDHMPNKAIFAKYWKEVPKGTLNAIQCKNMKWFIKL